MADKLEKIVCHFRNGAMYIDPAFEDKWIELEGQNIVISYVTNSEAKARSLAQNAAMWLWGKRMATKLNDAGFDQLQCEEAIITRGGLKGPWTKEAVIDRLWRPFQRAVTGEVSTKKPKPGQYGEIFKIADKEISEMTNGIQEDWPTQEGKRAEMYNNE